MAVETDAQIKARITEIREETAPSGNTAERIAAALENIYNTATQLDPSNFAPYDPDREYSNAAPDYVSYNDGTATNSYEYIYATPSTGNVPTNTTYWRLVSAGQFNHIQNTDTHTTSRIYEIGKLGGTLLDTTTGDPIEEPTGSVVLVFGRANDNARKTAIREFWETVEGAKEYHLQFCLDYTGTGSDVWVDFGGVKQLRDAAGNLINPEGGVAQLPEPAIYLYDETKTYYAPQLTNNNGVIWMCNTDAGTTGPFNASDWIHLVSMFPQLTTGAIIDFLLERIYNSPTYPESGNITFDLTNAQDGVVSKLYHNSGTEPTIGGKAIGDNSGVGKRLAGTYVPGVLNIFHFSHDFGLVVYTISQYS